MDMRVLSIDKVTAADWSARRAEIAVADPSRRDELLGLLARASRRTIVETIARAGQGHIGGDLSVIDLLTALYHHVLRVDPANPTDPGRDRMVLSKGHCAVALYTTLASCGYFPSEELATFMRPGSPLSGHPNRNHVPGVETNTGPLGHGLPFAVGCALGARLRGGGQRVFVILGDGEMQEGSNWEALMAAAHYGLGNLVAVIDRNRLQQGDRTESTNRLEPLGEKLAAFGWEVREIDGHDFGQILGALGPSSQGCPVAVVARTIKGRGVSFMEDGVAWHHKVPSPEQLEQALKELA
jgi:transketolase